MTTKEIQGDFEELTMFANQYAIAPLMKNSGFVAELKNGHKRLFALLTFIAEIESTNSASRKFNEVSLRYFAEFGSDVSQALFCWMHGAYKPAYLALRSSIETFFKAAVGSENPTILTQKNVYELLEIAKASKACGGLARPYFLEIKQHYGELCKIAHSATAASFTQVHALRMFPKYEEADATQFITQFIGLVDRFIAVLLATNRELLPEMHYKNRQNLLDTLTQRIKRSILGEEER